MEVLLIIAVGVMNICCLFFGVKAGQKVAKGEEVKIPSLNPVKAVREAQAQKELDREQAKERLIMENINNYNGTEFGQKDVN
ncbi:MAG: hypothetical protein IJO73_02395 [Clostridia bacterium]|nr:hypothetical protein [Clostridia bacterium]